ncbi:hypothetical protein [Microbacterium halophytorum]|uniref:hypothetical protein n=1 Tax=Microbacterium halophytorum TaxID=2067568 RepID=UPI000CFCC7B2|nr:hypothetical protein [Microbacterium halophytorum]
MADHYQRLLDWLARREDVLVVDAAGERIRMRPSVETYEGPDGDVDAPAEFDVQIPRAAFEAAYPHLCAGARDVGLVLGDAVEAGVFSLFDVHLDESVNSLTSPGPHGFRYVGGGFVPC